MRTPRQTLSVGWGALSVATTGLLLLSPRAHVLAHAPSCAGTLSQLSVVEEGKTAVASFRFSLAMSGEGSTGQAALTQLNQRLAQLRQLLQPFLQGRLIVPSPSTYPRSRSKGGKPSFVSNTGVSGEVKRQMYNQLIQAVGGQPGVRMQGMNPLPMNRLRQRFSNG